MDFKSMKKKLIKNGFSKVSSFVLTALTVIFLIMAIPNFNPDKSQAVSYSNRKKEVGSYGYLDIIAYDEWVCKYDKDTYYIVYDTPGNVYLTVISSGTLKKISAKETLTDEFTHYLGEKYRLYGMVERVNSKVVSMVEDVYGISRSDYNEYIGPYYMDTTDTPNSNTGWMWVTFAIFSGMFAAIFFLIWTASERAFNKENADYTEDEFSEASKMLDEADRKQKVIFGDHFIINRGTSMLIRYSDILWIHLVDTYYNGVKMGRTLGIHTRKRNYYKIAPKMKDSAEELCNMMSAIVERNGEVLVGHTPENKREYDSMTK